MTTTATSTQLRARFAVLLSDLDGREVPASQTLYEAQRAASVRAALPQLDPRLDPAEAQR